MMTKLNKIQPFTIGIPQADLDDLEARLALTRFTDEIPGSGSEYGVSVEWVKGLVDYWRSGYDWRKWEARLNTYPQFTTEIEGQNIHRFPVNSSFCRARTQKHRPVAHLRYRRPLCRAPGP